MKSQGNKRTPESGFDSLPRTETVSRRRFIGGALFGAARSSMRLGLVSPSLSSLVHGTFAVAPTPVGKAQISPSDPGARLVTELYGKRRGSGRLVPDTLDIQDNALLAISAITRGLDPSAEYRPWFAIYFDRRPLCMRHDVPSEFDLVGKYAECLTLLRLMTASDLNAHLDAKIWELMERHTRSDGLVYLDANDPQAPPANAYTDARVLNARICRFELNPTPELETQIDRTFDAMVARKMTRGFGFGPLLPACKWYRLTRGKRAFEMARLDWEALEQAKDFAEDGSFSGHFHYHSGAALGLLAYGLMTEDDALLHKVCRIYEFARSNGTDYGYFPEALPPLPWVMRISNEGCCTADMTSLAAALSRSGVADYWDDLDRYLRNQLTEMQMRHGDFVDRIPDVNKVAIPIRPDHGESELDDMRRFIGCFAGWAAPNDFLGPAHFWVQQCCLGNGPRGLYQGWENIVTPAGSGLRVNLLLNRSTREIDVDSHLPYEGKVEIRIKEKTTVAVRIPCWVDLKATRVEIGGQAVQPKWEGRYAKLSGLDPGAHVVISFPVTERQAKYRIPGAPWTSRYSIVDRDSGSGMPLPKSVAETPPDIVERILEPVEYRLRYRGNTIVNIEPAGAISPLYLRGEMAHESRSPMRPVRRHMPARVVQNWL
jgi:hypothetical protein